MSDRKVRSTTTGEVVVYEAPDGGPLVVVVVQDETVWLTQRQMTDLFGTTVANVNLDAGALGHARPRDGAMDHQDWA